jgi:hypothetical protein
MWTPWPSICVDAATDKQIDARVYELYELGDDEIVIVEGTSDLRTSQHVSPVRSFDSKEGCL